jgi:VWFA-related protein
MQIMKTSIFLRSTGTAAVLVALLPLFSARAVAQTEPAKPPTPAATPGQAPATPGPTVASAVGAVSLPVTVVNDKGDPVKGLVPGDVKLTDNGTPQTIQSFAPAMPTPMAIGILGQTTPGQRFELGDERLGSVHFVDHVLPGTQDTAFVIQYGGEVDLLSEPTATANKLHDAINKLGSPEFGNQNGSGDTSDSDNKNSDSPHLGGATIGGTLYDAIYLATNEILKKQPGQHVLILVGDGIDHGSQETMSDAVEAAQNTNTAIFAILYKSEEEHTASPSQNTGHRTGGGLPGGGGGFPGGGGSGGGYPSGGQRGGDQHPSVEAQTQGRENFIHLCDATGGYMIEGKRDKSDEAYNKLLALLHSQYTLTFVPTKDAQDSDSQRLVLATEKKGVYPLMQQGIASPR